MTTPNAHDLRVATLRTDIATKREALAGRSSRFTPITNCSLELDGARYNLHTLGRETLVLLAVKLQILKTATAELKFADSDLIIGGFTAADWLTDVRARLAIVALRAEEAKLNALDKQLAGLLSDDAKTELALDEITAALA